MMRSHGTQTPREIFQFGKKGDWAYDVIADFINLRYRLLPYIYSTSYQVTQNAGSMMRALIMDFPHDKRVYDMDNEYLFGNSILVNPVTEPMYIGRNGDKILQDFSEVKKQNVYLPQGCDWVDFWTGQTLKGGQEIAREVPINVIPLYVKTGTILPMGPFVQYAEEKDWSNLEIRIYPGADGEFTLYEDENDNYNYEKGQFSTIHFQWDDLNRELRIDKRKGSFPGMLKERKFRFIIVDRANGTGAGESINYTEIDYAGKPVSVSL
jgi:alpha-D-xyloside xylohydrolase